MSASSQEENVTLPDQQPALRVVPGPADTNMSGDIFGGWVMSQVDIAGGVAAGRYAKGRVVTVAVNSFLFKQAIHVGDLVSFYADVVKAGRTSITVEVKVFAQRFSCSKPRTIKVTEAVLTFVALDNKGEKKVVAPLG